MKVIQLLRGPVFNDTGLWNFSRTDFRLRVFRGWPDVFLRFGFRFLIGFFSDLDSVSVFSGFGILLSL